MPSQPILLMLVKAPQKSANASAAEKEYVDNRRAQGATGSRFQTD